MSRQYTLSQIARILTSLEEDLSRDYRKLAESTSNPLLSELSKIHDERGEQLREISQKTVVEMALEPITLTGFEEEIDKVKTLLESGDKPEKIAAKLEESLIALYNSSASKIIHVSGDIALLLRQFAKNSKKILKKLT